MRKTDNTDTDKKTSSHFRSTDRFVRIDGKWWFSTRDGDEGPFISREQAEMGLRSYVASQQFFAEQEGNSEPKQVQPSQSTSRGDPTIWGSQLEIL